MKKRGMYRVVILSLALALAIVAAAVVTARNSCNTYYNSRATWIQGYGGVCAYTGSSCTECVGPGGGETCVENGGGSACQDYRF